MTQGARAVRIGKNIKMFRDQADMTQEELATQLGLAGGAQISQFEAGTKLPPLEKAMDIASQLGVSLSQLVGEHPPPGTLPGHVTNHIHGDNQTVYQHVERACMVTEDTETLLTTLVQQQLEQHRLELVRLFNPATLLAAVQEAVRLGMQEALRANGSEAPRPIRPSGTEPS
jgi:transcriptional regulator with XRE-family HTH domain